MKPSAIIIGTGGHCRAVLSLLAASGPRKILGILDLAESPRREVIMGVPVVGSTSALESLRRRRRLEAFLAIGDNATRRIWWERLRTLGFSLPNLISPEATVDAHAKLGTANMICARAFIGPMAILGDNNLINTGAIVEHEVTLGSHCHLAPAVTIAGRSRLGDGCFVGAGATIIDRLDVAAGTLIGAGATVVCSIAISDGVYVGVPARRTAAPAKATRRPEGRAGARSRRRP